MFDLYEGAQVAAGKKSLALRLSFRAPDRTLSEAEVNEPARAMLAKSRPIWGRSSEPRLARSDGRGSVRVRVCGLQRMHSACMTVAVAVYSHALREATGERYERDHGEHRRRDRVYRGGPDRHPGGSSRGPAWGPHLASRTWGGGWTDVFPHLRVDGSYVPYSPESAGEADVAFVCYPHAEAHAVVAELVDSGCRVVDLSADFRLKDPAGYERWYGFEHPRRRPGGRGGLRTARGVPGEDRHRAHGRQPGLLSHRHDPRPASRRPPTSTRRGDRRLEVGGVRRGAHALRQDALLRGGRQLQGLQRGGHRHTAEMVQELAAAAGTPLPVSFTPHLLPVDRGILSTHVLPARRAGSWAPTPGWRSIRPSTRASRSWRWWKRCPAWPRWRARTSAASR